MHLTTKLLYHYQKCDFFFLHFTETQGTKEKPLTGTDISIKYQRQVVLVGNVMFVNDNRI